MEGEHVLLAVGYPIDGLVEPHGSKGYDQILGEHTALFAEASSHVIGDDSYFVPREAQQLNQLIADSMSALGRGPHCEEVVVRGVVSHTAAGLHGKGSDALDGVLLGHDAVSTCEGIIKALALAVVILAHGDIGAQGLVDRYRVLIRSLGWVEDGRERLVLHLDLLDGVTGDVALGGDDASNGLADEEGLAMGQGGKVGNVEGVHLPFLELPSLQASYLAFQVCSGYHHLNTGHLTGLGGVDGLDNGMGVRAAQESGVRHAGQLDVVNVLALSGDETGVFEPLNRLADVWHFTSPSTVTPQSAARGMESYWVSSCGEQYSSLADGSGSWMMDASPFCP